MRKVVQVVQVVVLTQVHFLQLAAQERLVKETTAVEQQVVQLVVVEVVQAP
jgi:hypothetical protein